MRLNSLSIRVNEVPIRVISFKDGLSIITNKKGVGRSGNSVGKSTLSRIIDYLFLGSIDPIYIDEEFSKPNETIESLFKNSIVEAELIFIGLDNVLHQISRNLCINNADCKYYFDGEKIIKKEYEVKLQSVFFAITTRRPSIRFLAPKFIRNESHRMLNTTKFLDEHQSSKDYSELFIYLFGFQNTNLLTEKRDAANLIKKRDRNKTSINAIIREQKPQSLIISYKTEIKELEEQFLKFDYSPEYNDPISYLNELQENENRLTERILSIDRKISNIIDTTKILTDEGVNYLSNELKEIYEFAGVSIESGIREYEEVILFHKNLVVKKKNYLTINLPSLEKIKDIYLSKLNVIQENKVKVFSNLRSKEHIQRISESLKTLGELKESLGKIEGVFDQQVKANLDSNIAHESLTSILKQIEPEFSNVILFESEFNKEFKRITSLVHGEEYSFNLNFDMVNGNCNLEVINNSPNPEGGKKKAEVIAFDLSYIYTVYETKSKRPNFVFHDSIEDIDQKQVDVLFELARKLHGQQIVSMLSENLSEEMYKKYYEDIVLFLSDDDMFFKV